MKRRLQFIATALLLTTAVAAQTPGSFDLNLNGTGHTTVDFGDDDIATKVLVQPDQKIVLVGASVDGSDYYVAVARLFPDGSPDPSFSYDGRVQTLISTTGGSALDAAIQPDGKIVVVGYASTPSGVGGFLVRYEADGTLDNTFGTNGMVWLLSSTQTTNTTSIVVANDGKLVCGGVQIASGQADAVTLRFNTDGTLDDTYSFDGISGVDVSGDNEAFWDVVIQPDGKIVGVGTTENTANETRFLVARFNSDGTIDNTFNATGYNTIDFGTLDNDGQAVALQGDKILVAGKADIGTPFVMATARLLSNGTLDPSYGSSGKYYIPFYGGNIAGCNGIAIQQDGKLLFGGYMDDSSLDRNFALARTTADGALDLTFDTDGKVETDLGGVDHAYSVAVQDDGLILLAGRTSSTTMDFALVRYISGVDVGIGEVESHINSTLVYPNPIVGNQVTVEYELKSDEAVSIRLFDLTGKQLAVLQAEIREQAGVHQKSLSLPALSAGNYLLRFNAEKGSVTVKVFVN